MWERSMSPVEICGASRHCFSNLACVPLPDPGEPNRTIAGAQAASCPFPALATAPANSSRARSEAVVMPHDQLGFDLVDRVHRHSHHNQQRSAAEIERYAQAIEQPARKMSVDEI